MGKFSYVKGEKMSRKITIILSIIIAAALAATMGACNGAEESESPSEIGSSPDDSYDFGGITILKANHGGADPDPETEDGRRRLARIAELEDKFNVNFEMVRYGGAGYGEAIFPSILAGSPNCDFFVGTTNLWWNLIGNNLIYPISDLDVFDLEDDEKWDASVLEATTFQGKNYGIEEKTWHVNKVLYFNKSMLEREGAPSPYDLQASGEWTWDKMFEIAETLTKDTTGDGEIDQWGIADNAYELAMHLILSNDANILEEGEDGIPYFALTQSRAIESLNVYRDVTVNRNIVTTLSHNPELEREYARDWFTQGRVGFMPGYHWFAWHIFRENMEDDYGAVMFPKGPNMDDYIMNYDWWEYYVIPSTHPDPEAIAVFMDAYFEPLYSQDEAENAYWQQLEDTYRDMESLEAYRLSLDGRAVVNQIFSFPINWHVIFPAFGEIASGAKTPSAAMQEIEGTVNSRIDDAIIIE